MSTNYKQEQMTDKIPRWWVKDYFHGPVYYERNARFSVQNLLVLIKIRFSVQNILLLIKIWFSIKHLLALI